MEQQDYLKRQIDQIGMVLTKILSDFFGLKSKGQISSGVETSCKTLKEKLSIDIESIVEINTDNFINELVTERKFNNDNLYKLADIMLLIADNRQDQKTKLLYEKCLTIYEYLEKSENVYALDRQWKIDRIKNTL